MIRMTIKNRLRLVRDNVVRILTRKQIDNISEIKNYNSKKSSNQKPRINLMITSLQKNDVYAGIKSALDFFMKFDKYDVDLRILVMNKKINIQDLYDINNFKVLNSLENDAENKTIIDISEENAEFYIRENDIFIGTMWFTIYNMNSLLQKLKLSNKLIYLIQDYEPGFYPWSSHFLLAESTYAVENVTAVFNSKSLYDYFKMLGYEFENEFYFKPVLNEKLSKKLKEVESKNIARKNKILIYGRPSKNRNSFELITMALRKWSELDSNSINWEIYAMGENIDNLKINEKIMLKSLGKMSIEEYASQMLTSKIGISLMASPHPSYPPLEMATFGMKVITNNFYNKDISNFNENIISINHITVEKLANQLLELTTGKLEFSINVNSDYVNGINEIDNIVDKIAEKIGLK